MTEPDKVQSPAFLVLRASAHRVLRLIESELARQGGAGAVIYADQLELAGSRRIWRPALAELHAVGLLDISKHPKRFICRPSNRWRQVTAHDARIASTLAREHCNDPEANHVERVGADTVA